MKKCVIDIHFFKRLFLYSVLLFFSTSFRAQTSKAFALGGSYLFGYNINKNSDREFGSTHPIGFEVFYQCYRNGSKYWEKLYNYPQTGWAVSWINHRNKELGSSFTLNRYLNYIFFRRNKIEFYLKPCLGIMVASDIYDSDKLNSTHFNNAISQYVNFSAQLGLGTTINVTKKININLASTFSHYSNGAMSQPNDGLNLIMFHLGLAYITQEISNSYYQQPVTQEDNRNLKYNINVGAGVKQINPTNKNKYPLLTLCFYADKKLSRVNALNVGVDVFINSAVKHQIENDSTYQGVDYKRIGITLGHELFIDKLGLLTQLGYHVYSPYPAYSDFYQKFGAKYYFTDKLFATFNVKILNFEISDEVSWGVGFRI